MFTLKENFNQMPELPEVERFKKYVDKTSRKKKIDDVKVRAPKMLLKTSQKQLEKTLIGNSITGTFRHGKFLFLNLQDGGHLMVHFGLTGDLMFVKPDGEAPSTFALQLHFDDDASLFFTDTRKMGKFSLVDDLDKFIGERGYGKDALEIKQNEFVPLVKGRRVAIKTALMNQKIVAGVGNEFSDEILFQTRIHPATPAADLPEKKLVAIYKTMVSVLKESVKQNADREKLRQYFFLENRKKGLKCPRCGMLTEFQTIGGRSSYYCPSCQKMMS